MKFFLRSIIGLAFLVCSSASLFAQTVGTLTCTFTQVVHSPCYSASKNVMAVWIQTSTGTFVKTKLRNVGSVTVDHLPAWAFNSGGPSTNALSSSCNKTDATTGATLLSFGTKTIVWDGRGVSGSVNGPVVADGVYKVTIESTWNHGSGSTVLTSFTFTKGPTADHQTPANTADFTGIILDWVPSGAGVEDLAAEPQINIYPNPTSGMFKVDFDKATSIQVVDLLGATVFNEKLEDPYSGTKNIDLNAISNGIYFICVYNEDRSTKRKLILNK